ncbi:hypothetical protein A3I53_04025 [Candidatus Curtissbacteria bacterium RIFCSPLOWO2_02_FULL_40_13b]|uniref:Uncharacterized protein n=2 Tax=Candidatus Curtissiibacteriota TaxID=1752717 RepID=A0A1F5HYE6_9BACT|nr:MAG: hypothetical protein A3F45_00230 [Candidatus Curtissbacteria bacterium RIFCSPHIGHO2_12_FULL_41_17]OGE09126.1 MAG: hypothetical protein A3I53_04025 [Candidatus Curtissbacteria bacterium RIFCSPLOWO2_02_FULL_40_13b]
MIYLQINTPVPNFFLIYCHSDPPLAEKNLSKRHPELISGSKKMLKPFGFVYAEYNRSAQGEQVQHDKFAYSHIFALINSH